MLNIFSKFFDTNEKEIKKLKPIVEEINLLEKKTAKLKLTDFPKKTAEFKESVSTGQSLDLILPQAFALVREAAKRAIGQRHFDSQLLAGIVLSQGKIAEQRTGEGKTLSAVPALYLNSLNGKTVHLVTVNDYLARRDAGWMGPVFHMLGLSVSSIIGEESFTYDPDYVNKTSSDFRLLHLKPISRKEAYEKNIVYGINSEFGFDYLRDNMAVDKNSLVQNGHSFAVVDEVDSVLIDEARTPHIISAPDEAPTKKYYEYSSLVRKLNSETDYKIDEKLKTAHLTDRGISKIEKLFGIGDIYEKDFDTVYHLEAALKAMTLFSKEKDYIVRNDQVILVDEFTGRLLTGRRLSEGLHQALEAKEGVTVQRESKTLATISLQNYFRMYQKLAGMTGTAVTEAEEFHKIYKLETVVIPTHRPMIRKDEADAIYKTQRAKISAVVEAIEQHYKKGQPILIGTTSIDKNEIISQALRRRGIKHEVLNAKNHEKEAEIIAKAGMKGAVTVATNMAGRGVDIILGGDTPKSEDGYDKKDSREWKAWEKGHNDVVALGGLRIIATERHESRRIDNQLRGRSGRQGDPGSSRFYVALDDEIMRLFGGDMISGMMTKLNMPEDVALTHPLVSRAIEQAQIKVEGYNFDIRKHLVEYDDVLDKQREIIYRKRRKILEPDEKDSLAVQIKDKIQSFIENLVRLNESDQFPAKIISQGFSTMIPFDSQSLLQIEAQLEQLKESSEKVSFLTKAAFDIYQKRMEDLGEVLMKDLEKFVMLSVIDNLWIDHLDALENLRQGVGLRGYGQRDPLVEYKNEGYSMFEKLIFEIDDQIVHRIYKIQVQSSPVINVSPKVVTNENNILNPKTRPGRNDPCPCGAKKTDGTPKKYKNCHYPQYG